MKLVLPFLFSLLAFSLSSMLVGQETATIEYSRYSLKLSAGNHAVGFPYDNSFSAFNPHFSVGTEKQLNRNTKHSFLLGSSIGFIRNEVIGNTILMDLDLGYRITGRRGLFFDMALGLGILHQFRPHAIYQQNASDGSYVQIKDKGRSSSLIGLKTGFGYDFSRKTNLPISLALTHNFFIQTSYFDLKAFPIMPQSTTNILITYKFKKS